MSRLPRDMSLSSIPERDLEPVDAGGPDAAAAAPTDPLARIHSLLRGRYWLAALLATVGLAAGGFGGYRLQTPQYESTGLVQIKPIIPAILYQTDLNGDMPRFESFVDSQVALMSGERVIKMAMEDPEWVKLGRGLSAEATLDFMRNLNVSRAKGSELVTVQVTDPDPVAAQTAVGAVIRAYQRRHGEEDPDGVGRRIAVLEERKNVFAGELTALNGRIRDIATEYGSPAIEQIHQFKMAELNKLESLLHEAELAVALAEGAPASASTHPGTHPATRPATRPARGATAAAAARGQQTEPPAAERQQTPEELSLVSPELRELLASRRELQRRVSVDRARFGRQHARVADGEASLAVIEEQIREVSTTVRRLQDAGLVPSPEAGLAGITAGRSLERLRAEEHNVRPLFAKAKAEAMEVGRKAVEVSGLKAEADVVRARLEETKLRIDQLNLESNGSIDTRINVEGWGDRPLAPAKDKRRLAAAFGAVGLGGAGFGLVLLIGFLDQRVRHLDDVHHSLRYATRVLGVLPYLPDADGEADVEQSTRAANGVHQLRTLLQRRRALTEKPVFAITSPTPGAGKTSLAVALGLSFAASGARTLIIDCDIIGGGLTAKMKWAARRRLGHILRRNGLVTASQVNAALATAKRDGCRIGRALVSMGFVTPDDVRRALGAQADEVVGLREALHGDPVNECISGTGTPRLFVLPLGSAHRHHAPQLSYAALRGLLNQVRQWFDVIIIDTGPILGSLEAAVVAMAADEVVLTVTRGDRRPLVQRAAEQLVASGANVAGIVLNRAGADDLTACAFSSSAESTPALEPPAPAPAGEHKFLRLGPIATAVAAQTDFTGPGASGPDRPIRNEHVAVA